MIVFPKGLITPQLYRIRDLAGGIADLNGMSLGAVEMQTPLRELRRYRVRTTDEVTHESEPAEVIRIVNPRDDDYYEYEIEVDGETRTVPEYELMVLEGSMAPNPADMLAQLDGTPWKLANARTRLLEAFFSATARSLGVVGYNGARMLPIPHQINAARYAAQFGRVRFLLADEVGLGKTVEAGLIATTIRKYFPSWQTAIFVPESLTAQWAFEMYGKFGKQIYSLDMKEYDPEEHPGVILPHFRARTFCIKNQPEILIVDEAHRVLQDPRLYDAFRRMSKTAHVVLLLTATPVSDNADNILNLLKILDPETFDHFENSEEIRDLQSRQGKIENLLLAIRAAEPDHETIVDAWAETGLDDEEIEDYLESAGDDTVGRHSLHRAAALIVDRYYPGSRILRYRRKFLALDNPLPFRIVDGLDYKATSEETDVMGLLREWLDLIRDAELSKDPTAHRYAGALIQAVHSSPHAVLDWIELRSGEMEPHAGVTADPVRLILRGKHEMDLVKGEEEFLERFKEATLAWAKATRSVDVMGRALAEAPRYKRLLEFLHETFKEDPNAHPLIFTSFETNVHALYLLLKKVLTGVSEVYEMSGQIDRIEREKAAFEFQEETGGCILVSDELGGEGRNFQFATHVVHFDLPAAAWMVEQRIGRCDRVGREEEMDVDSQVLVAKGCLDEVIFDFLCDGVGVFNDSIAPVESEMERVMHDMMATCIEKDSAGILDLIEPTAEELEDARERENRELLIRSAVGVEEAHKIAETLRDDAELETLKEASIRYARHFESMVDDQGGGRVHVTVGEFHSLHGVPGIRAEMLGYYDRRQAVRHERLDFFSTGHPFIRTMVLQAMTESPDRAAFVQRDGVETPCAVFSYRYQIPQEFFQAVRSMPVDLQPPLLSKSAALFHSRMDRIAIELESGKLVTKDDEAGLVYDDWREGDKSLHEGEEILELLPVDYADEITSAANLSLEEAERRADALLATHRSEFEDLLCEVLTRVHPDHELLENEIIEIMDALSPLTADLDSAVLFLPA